MNRIFSGIVILLVSFDLFAQAPGEIIDRFVASVGGQENLAQYENYRAKGDVTVVWGREVHGKVIIIQKREKSWKKYDFDFSGEKYEMIEAYDGQNAFSTWQGDVSDVPPLNYESDLNHTFSVLVASGVTFAFAKETEIQGEGVIGIEADVEGNKTLLFISKNDHTIREIVYKDLFYGENLTKESLDKRIRFMDYKTIDGVLVPMVRTFYEKGQKILEYRFDEIVFSPQVPASRFLRPEQELDLRYWEEKID